MFGHVAKSLQQKPSAATKGSELRDLLAFKLILARVRTVISLLGLFTIHAQLDRVGYSRLKTRRLQQQTSNSFRVGAIREYETRRVLPLITLGLCLQAQNEIVGLVIISEDGYLLDSGDHKM